MFEEEISILGVKIKRGESKSLEFDVAKLHTPNSIKVPIFIQRAEKDGPVLLLLGGVHGDEINGVEIIRRIIRACFTYMLRMAAG
jgi:predicted deacylase